MKFQVRFRFNKRTGEVEEFRVDDRGEALPESDHDRRHEGVAGELGRLLERHPAIHEITDAGIALSREQEAPNPEEGQADTPERKRNKQ